jgi:hypothetical protein
MPVKHWNLTIQCPEPNPSWKKLKPRKKPDQETRTEEILGKSETQTEEKSKPEAEEKS